MWSSLPLYEKVWMTVGFLGQGIFTARFLVQWAASEKKKDSVVPVAFWWISLAGGVTLLSYAIHKMDPPIILGQAMGLVVYIRNLMLVDKSRRRAARRQARAESATTDPAEPAPVPPAPMGNSVPRPHRIDAGSRV